jgi:hypothetical protein
MTGVRATGCDMTKTREKGSRAVIARDLWQLCRPDLFSSWLFVWSTDRDLQSLSKGKLKRGTLMVFDTSIHRPAVRLQDDTASFWLLQRASRNLHRFLPGQTCESWLRLRFLLSRYLNLGEICYKLAGVNVAVGNVSPQIVFVQIRPCLRRRYLSMLCTVVFIQSSRWSKTEASIEAHQYPFELLQHIY